MLTLLANVRKQDIFKLWEPKTAYQLTSHGKMAYKRETRNRHPTMTGLEITFLIPAFFLTALLYAMVGFGGGSTYIALLFLLGVPYLVIPKIALICNIVVVAGSTFHFIKDGTFSFRRALPFVLFSVPCAYLAGATPISKRLFLILMFISLTFAGLRLLIGSEKSENLRFWNHRKRWIIGSVSGSALGFLSGLVGIGGGIFLAPLLYFLGWGKAKEIAAISSFFILVNSVSGLAGQFAKIPDLSNLRSILILSISVFLGGQVGSYLCRGKLSSIALQRCTAVFILFVAGRIAWTLL